MLIKKRLQHRCFPVKICEIFKNICEWLPLQGQRAERHDQNNEFQQFSLREKCPIQRFFWSVFSRIPTFHAVFSTICWIVLLYRIKQKLFLTQTSKHIFFKTPKNKQIPNAPSRRFLRVLSDSVEGLSNFPNKQWKVRGIR